MKSITKLAFIASLLATCAWSTSAQAADRHHENATHRYAHHHGDGSSHHRSTVVESVPYMTPYEGRGPGIYDVRPANAVTFGFGGHHYTHWWKY